MSNAMLDALLREAGVLASTPDAVYADIDVNSYGTTVVVYATAYGHVVEGIVCAGTGRTLDEAIAAANAGMKSRS